jgi:hypothetical protein
VIQTVQPWAQSPKEASREGLDALPHLMEYSTGALTTTKNTCQVYFVKVQGTSTKKQFGRKKNAADKNLFFLKKNILFVITQTRKSTNSTRYTIHTSRVALTNGWATNVMGLLPRQDRHRTHEDTYGQWSTMLCWLVEWPILLLILLCLLCLLCLLGLFCPCWCGTGSGHASNCH